MDRAGGKNVASKTQKGGKKKKGGKIKLWLLAVEGLVLLVLAVVLFIVVKLSRVDQDPVFEDDVIEVNEDIPEVTKEVMEGFTTVVLFGLDNRSMGKLDLGNSDVIMIASVNNDTEEVRIVSVYRDTYLNIGNDTYTKCNAAYGKGGSEQAISMLNTNLDLEINDYVTVDFKSVVECVDLVGGVEVTVTDLEAVLMYGYMDEISKLTGKESEYLPGAGTYTLDGVQACAYARIRQTSGDDYKRTERQRLIVEKVVEKAQKSDLKTVNSLINELFADVKTSFSNSEMVSFATKIFNYKLGETAGFPSVKGTVKLYNSYLKDTADMVVPCDLETNVAELHEFLYGEDNYVPSDTVKKNSARIISDTGLSAEDGY